MHRGGLKTRGPFRCRDEENLAEVVFLVPADTRIFDSNDLSKPRGKPPELRLT